MNNKKAFTLIELLVVVLIIGILASVALPQYQKAVEKSKATQAFVLLDSIRTSFDAYYMANGNYPTKFADVDLSWPDMTGNVSQLNIHVQDTMSNNDWSVEIQTGPNSDGVYYMVSVFRISGKYKGAGFMWHTIDATQPDWSGKIICNEVTSGIKIPFTQSAGSYCKNIFKGTESTSSPGWRNYFI